MGEFTDFLILLYSWLGKYTNVKKMRICFLIWGVEKFYWFFRNWNNCLYTQSVYMVFSLAFQIYAYIKWAKDDKKKLLSQSLEKEKA
jgi:hypothetical protein